MAEELLQLCKYPDQHEDPSSIVQRLFKNGVDINVGDEEGNSPLHLLCKSGNRESHFALILFFVNQVADIDTRNHEGWTPLHMLCRYNQSESFLPLLNMFVEKKADVNAKTNLSCTPLIYVCSYNQSQDLYEIIKKLLKAGADVDVAKVDGNTALHYLIYSYSKGNLVEIVSLLTDKATSLNMRNRYGHTPLHLASKFCKKDYFSSLFPLLLNRGSDVNLRDRKNWTALHLLCRHNQTDKMPQHISSFIEKGFHIDTRTDEGWTPLMILCRHNSSKSLSASIQIFVTNGADVNLKTHSHLSVLDCLCINGIAVNILDAIHVLMKKLSSETINSVDRDGNTVMHRLAKIGCFQSVNILSSYVLKNVRNVFDRSVIDYMRQEIEIEATSLCLCCSAHSKILDPIVEQTFASKPNIKYDRLPFIKEFLETNIPQHIDEEYLTNMPQRITKPLNELLWLEFSERIWWRNEDSSMAPLSSSELVKYLNQFTHSTATCHEQCQWCHVTDVVHDLIRDILRRLEELDSKFTCQYLVAYGGSAEGTKVLSPNEYDFMIVLDKFHESETSPFCVECNVKNDSQCFYHANGCVSSGRLLYYFQGLLTEIVLSRLDSPRLLFQNVTYGETCATVDFIYRGRHLPPLPISVDLTIGIRRCDKYPLDISSKAASCEWCRVRKPQEKSQYLVPYRSRGGQSKWKPSFPSLERDSILHSGQCVLHCFQLMKLLILLAYSEPSKGSLPSKTSPSTYVLKMHFMEYLVKKPPPWQLDQLVSHCIHVLESFLYSCGDQVSFFDGSFLGHFPFACEARIKVAEIIRKLQRLSQK